MTSGAARETTRTNLWRAIAVILGFGALLYVASSYSVAADSQNRMPSGNIVGIDYSTFHAGATMLRYGDADKLYDLDAMTALLREVRRGPAARVPSFLNPPSFAMVLTPLAPLRYEVGLALWTVFGVSAFAVGLRAIGTSRLALVVSATMLSVPGFLGMSLGQGQLFWAAIFAGVLSRLRTEKPIQAGLLAALLVLKPQLLAPIILWWLVDWRRHHRSLVTVLLASSALSLAPAIVFPGSYSGYATMLQAASSALPLGGIPMGVTLRDSVDALVGGSSVWSGVVVVVGVGILAAVLVHGIREGWSTDVMFIVVTTGGLLVVPHLLMYDWILLVPAGVVYSQRSPARGVLFPAIVAGLLYSLLFQSVLGDVSFERFGTSIQFAPVILLLALVAAVRQLLHATEDVHAA